MHFTVSWDIEAEGDAYNRIYHLMKDTVKRHADLVEEPLLKYFIVKIENEAKWELILRSLKGVAEMHKGKIEFVMSPPMKGGMYNGRLRDWTKVNETTK